MKKLISLVIISSWMAGTLCLYARVTCAGMDCCSEVLSTPAENETNLKAVECPMASCAMTSGTQDIQAKRTGVLSSTQQGFTSVFLVQGKNDLDFSRENSLLSSYQLRIRDGCHTYLELQHFLI